MNNVRYIINGLYASNLSPYIVCAHIDDEGSKLKPPENYYRGFMFTISTH